MLDQLNLYGQTKLEVAIERLKDFEPKEGYFVAFSGGKDSIVVKKLCDLANVKYDAHYSVTSVDPPELVTYIKKYHPDVIFDYPRDKYGNRITMWNLIPQKHMPPTRLIRYCCSELKEIQGEGRFVVTGVRWAESVNRKKNQGTITIYNPPKELIGNPNFSVNKQGGVVLNNDNDESREIIDSCYKMRKTVINPIIDWDDDEVWEFIKRFNVPYCELYDKGFKRIGCIGCPMSTHIKEGLEHYPIYKRNYLKAFERMLANSKKETNWKTAEDVMRWWLQE